MSSTTFQTHSLPTSTDTYSSNCGRTGAHGLKASPSRSGEWHHLYRAQKHRKLLRSRKKYPREKMKKNKIINIKLRIMIIFDEHGNFLFLKESDRFTFILLRFMTYICFPWEILLEVDILGYQISSFQAHILYNNAITMLSHTKMSKKFYQLLKLSWNQHNYVCKVPHLYLKEGMTLIWIILWTWDSCPLHFLLNADKII